MCVIIINTNNHTSSYALAQMVNTSFNNILKQQNVFLCFFSTILFSLWLLLLSVNGIISVCVKCDVILVIAGPQAYNVSRGMAAESLYKAYLASTLHGAFGSSAERKGPLSTGELRQQPGPAHYQPPIAATCDTAPPRGRIIRATSNFASNSRRIKKPEHLVRVDFIV